jgi:hypothetical protein
MPNSTFEIKAFCEGLKEDRKLFPQNGKNFFVSDTPMPTFGCAACDRSQDTLGGVPHDGISTVFDQTFNRMNPVPRKCQKFEHNILLDLGFPNDISYIIQEYSKVFCDVSLYNNTKIIYLVPGTETKKSIIVNNTEVQISHYDTVVEFSIKKDYVYPFSVKFDVKNFFFKNHELTVGFIQKLIRKMRYFYDNNHEKLLEFEAVHHNNNSISNNTKLSLSTAIRDYRHIMNLPPLNFVNWIYQHTIRASFVFTLLGDIKANLIKTTRINTKHKLSSYIYTKHTCCLMWKYPEHAYCPLDNYLREINRPLYSSD